MSMSAWWRRLRSGATARIALLVVGAMVVSVVAVLAVRDPGYQVQAVNLTTKDVWVTNNSELLVGRINRQIDELNSAVRVSAPFDVLQDGHSVVVVDASKHELRPLDEASVTLAGRIPMPEQGVSAMDGGVLAIADETSGALWAGAPSALSSFDPAETPAAVITKPRPAVAVTQDGTVFAVAPGAATLWTIPAASADATATPSATSAEADSSASAEPSASASASVAPRSSSSAAPEVDPSSGATTADLVGGPLSDVTSGASSPISVTAVGNVPVVLDRAAGVLRLPSGAVKLPDAESAVLQQSGPAAATVLVATSHALLRVALDSGDVETVIDGQSGTPAAPVLLQGCAHAAWGTSGAAQGAKAQYGLACGSNRPTVRDVPGYSGSGKLVFRVNRETIVLNDVATGASWSVANDMKLINNWDQVQPLSDSDDQSDDNSGTEGSSQQMTSSRTNCTTGTVDPPAPADDSFGVRAGRSTVLPVLANDASSDCSMVIISRVDDWGDAQGAQVQIVASGQALQVTVPPDATGALPTLTYRVTDGAGHNGSARVVLTVAPPSQQEPPKKLHDMSIPVETLGTVSYNVLTNYISPNGDDLFLTSASIDTGDEVTFQPGGLITYSDKGVGGAVKKTVKFVVSDGVNQVPGELTIDVRPEGTVEPIAGPVYAQAVTGRSLLVDVMASVVTPSVAPTKLTQIKPIGTSPEALVQALHADAGTISVLGDKAGTYYYTYQVGAGEKSAQGILRIDVVKPKTDTVPPVAMADVVFLPEGGVATLDPTANDSDPMATGLALIQADPDEGLSVTTEQMHLLTISAQSTLPPDGAQISYQVSNSAGVATGSIRVVPVPAQTPVPPVARDIDATVRVGDAVTIPIADHAVDPNGEVIRLTSINTDTVEPGSGLLFHTDTAIRYLAPTVAPKKAVRFSYTVTNTSGVSQTAAVSITVDGTPSSTNHPPAQPVPVLARVFVGGTVTINLPLDGVDPDGDWVTLQSVGAPSLGVTGTLGLSSFGYRSTGKSGYDTFTYTAADPYGETTTGTVSVLVVDPPAMAQPPQAPNLSVVARPGRKVAVDVMTKAIAANPAQKLAFADPAFVAPPDWVAAVDPTGKQLVIELPQQETVASMKYTLVNDHGMTGSGVITVTVSATQPLKPPTAKDIVVDPSTIEPGQQSITVPIPDDKISNPSGTLDDLALSVDDMSSSAATVSGRSVTVTLAEHRQVIAYRVTNSDHQSAAAFIVVPSSEAVIPLSVTATNSVKVDAGKSVTVDIAKVLKAADGSTLQIPNGSKVSAADGAVVGRVDATHFAYTAPKDGDGPVMVTLSVTDGKRDPVTVQVPITVVPLVVPAPVVTSVKLPVEAGKSVEQDLSKLVKAGNAEQQKLLTYAVSKVDAKGITASLKGSILTVKADLDAKGSSATVTVTATDGQKVKKSGDGAITITVTGSTEPLLQVKDIPAVIGRPGVATTIPVLSAVTFNPFDKAPTVVDARLQSGKASVGSAGPTVAVTPQAIGTVVVSFTLRDASGDADRDVSMTATVIVKDKPGVPGTATVVSMASRTVELKWTAPPDNGSEITSYTVSDEKQGFSQSCQQSPCTLKDLTNGTEYSFTVVATNDQGTSEPSVASAPVTPDTAPNTPAAPTLTWLSGQQALQIDWKDPGSDGTPIDRYDLQITPPDETGLNHVLVENATTYLWPNLKYGTSYTFTLRAHNQSDTPSGWSPSSAPETPSTVASKPLKLVVSFGPDDFSESKGNTLSVTWEPPENNGGAPVESYVINYSSDGGDVGIIKDANPTLTRIQNVQDGATYKVTVTAVNRSNKDDPSKGKASDPSTAIPFSPPGQVTGVKATPTGDTGTVTVSWDEPQSHGKAADTYTVYWGSSGNKTVKGRSTTITGLPNGTSATFTVTACATSPDGSFQRCSPDTSAPVSATPYEPVGEIRSPSATPGAKKVTFTWSPPSSNGRPQMGAQYLDGSEWKNGTKHAVTTTQCKAVTLTLKVRGVDSKGLAGPERTLTGSTKNSCPPPEPTYPLAKVYNRAPMFSSLNPLNGPNGYLQESAGKIYEIQCKVNTHIVDSDGSLWFKIHNGPYSGQYSVGNNFYDWDTLQNQVPKC